MASSASFRFGEREVGGDAPCLIIAELSANHGGSLDVALRTVEAAKKAGADAIKLQTYTPDTLTLKCSEPHFVVKTKNEWAGRTLHDLYAEAMTPWEWHAPLKAAAEAEGLLWLSTPFDATAVSFLQSLGAEAYKVASFELIDLPLVERVARAGKPMILSTGMASLGEIEAALATCRQAGNDALAVLRCVSAYPADPASMDLRSIEILSRLGVVVGLSDHTRDAAAAITSVALGGKIIEKHFIVDRKVGGPDAFFSLEPDEFRAMVDAVRTTEAALGRPRFGPSAEEKGSVAFRRSLFVARDVQPGQILTCDDVRSVRPSHGLPAKHLPEVLGRPATRALRLGEPLAWEAVGVRALERELSLRPATLADKERLLVWRNDALTREMSISTKPVSPEGHAAWLEASLASKTRTLLVGEVGGEAVGTIRLDARSDRSTEVSITVAPEARGRGLATRLLLAAEEHAKRAGVLHLTARIRADNARSLAAFRRAGYYGFTQGEERAEGEVRSMFTCERRIAPYA